MQIVKLSAPLIECWYETREISVMRVDARLDFKPGQFAMMGFEGTGLKAMSYSSSPTKPYLEFAAKLTESEHKKKWASLKPGEPVIVHGSYGLFTLAESEPKIAMLAGGIGITPFKSYLEYALDKQLPIDFTLIYSNKTTGEIAFAKYFEELSASTSVQNTGGPKIRVVNTITRLEEGVQWSGRTGRINRQMIEEEVPDYRERLFYVCGVPEMVRDLASVLYEMGLDRKRVKREEFTGLH